MAAANQSTTAPDGADADKVTVPVPQRAFDVTFGAAGAAEITMFAAVLVADMQPVDRLRAWAKYADGPLAGTLMVVLPLATNVPPVDASYQSTVDPEATVADNVAESAPQVPPLFAVTGAEGNGFTVAVTVVLGRADIHPVTSSIARTK